MLTDSARTTSTGRHVRSRRLTLLAVVAASLAVMATPLLAHDFWVQPDAFQVGPGDSVPFSIQVGHGKDRERSAMPRRRILRFDAVAPGGRTLDLQDRLHLGEKRGDASASFDATGTYLVVLATDEGAISRLPAEKFNKYLDEEGLTPAKSLRERQGRTQAEGVERYGRRAKTLLQVGPATAKAQPHVSRPVGLTLELVPEVDPYAMPRPSHLPIRVYYQGRPLAGALVKRIDLDNDALPLETRRTDRAGRVRFAMPQRGRWLLATTWTRPLPEKEEVDFETVFSSLSFGVVAASANASEP